MDSQFTHATEVQTEQQPHPEYHPQQPFSESYPQQPYQQQPYPGQHQQQMYPGQYPQQPHIRKTHVASLVLSVIGLVFSLLLPIVTYPCSIVALVMAIRKRDTHKTTAALVMSIISLVVAIINSALGAFMGASGMLF